MKPRSRATSRIPSIVLCLGIASAGLVIPSAHAASATWTGATDNILNTAANWTAGGPPSGSGETATFDGTQAGPLALTWTGGFGATPAGTNFDVTGTQTDSLVIGSNAVNAGSATTNLLALGNITIASGAGAFTLGDNSVEFDNAVFRNPGGLTENILTNNSSNTATIASNVRFNSGGGAVRTLAFGGTGNWQVDAPWALGGSGGLGIAKNGAGILNVTNANTGSPGNTYAIHGGTLDFNGGSQTTGTLTFSATSSGAQIQNGTVSATSVVASNTAGTNTVSANLSGTGTVLLNGVGGTLTLAGDNSYTGSTTVGAAGTINITGSGSGNGDLLLTSNGTLNLSPSGIIQANSLQVNSFGTTVNVGAGSVVVGASGITSSGNSDFRNFNLNGGVLESGGNVFASGAAIAVSFNGGSLKSGNVSGITIFDSDNTFVVNAGGAILDTSTGNITAGVNATSVNPVRVNGTAGGTITVKGGNSFKSAVTTITGVVSIQDGSTWDIDGDSTVASSAGGLSGAAGMITNTGAAQTLTLNVASGSQVYGGAIGGGASISLTKSGAGGQTISGNNTFGGNLTVSGGSLALTGDNTLGGEILINGGATLELTGTNVLSDTNPIVQAGSTLSIDAASALGGVSSIQLGGGSGTGRLLYTGTGETINIEITSTAFSPGSGIILDQSGTGTLEFSNIGGTAGISSFILQGSSSGDGVIAGAIPDSFVGGLPLIKNGTGLWMLLGNNTYTGDTTINAGTLLVDFPSFADSSTVTIASGATLELNTGSTDVVAGLVIAGVPKPAGVYGATGSGAQFEDSAITGDGFLEVVPQSGYSTWAATNVNGQMPDEDFNNDGVDNGIAYFMNDTGIISLPGVVGGAVTWTNGGNIAAADYDTAFVVQSSQDLVVWTDVLSGGLTTNTDGPAGSLTYTLPTGQGKWFVRLVVTPD
ncbi:MAG: autotransporter-associated beta strand repeat-containing protein [Akkermansiaceae bacterium]|nr:autotransporter-associated beta strand repeat-containing protein [Akkermansiaceae bacterium]